MGIYLCLLMESCRVVKNSKSAYHNGIEPVVNPTFGPYSNVITLLAPSSPTGRHNAQAYQVRGPDPLGLPFVCTNVRCLRYRCAKCGQWETCTLKEHYKKVHQAECTVRFKGDPKKVVCQRDADWMWPCPRCDRVFGGSPKALQVWMDLAPISASPPNIDNSAAITSKRHMD